MRHLLNAIKASIAQQNWYAALSLTLVLPDICGWLEAPSAPTQRANADLLSIQETAETGVESGENYAS